MKTTEFITNALSGECFPVTVRYSEGATKTGKIPASVGFSQTSGTIRKLTRAEKKAQKDLQKTR